MLSRAKSTEFAIQKTHNINHYSSYQALIDAHEVAAVIIATPTTSHFEIAKYALQQSVHVMLEKPIGLSSYEGEALLTYQSPETIFALMLNQRTDPVFAKMKDIVDSGNWSIVWFSERCNTANNFRDSWSRKIE